MAGVINKTARQFNLKCLGAEGNRVLIRLVPGFNSVEDKHWEAFVPKGNKKPDPFVAELQGKGMIDYGAKVDDMELETDSVTKTKSKSEPVTKKAKGS